MSTPGRSQPGDKKTTVSLSVPDGSTRTNCLFPKRSFVFSATLTSTSAGGLCCCICLFSALSSSGPFINEGLNKQLNEIKTPKCKRNRLGCLEAMSGATLKKNRSQECHLCVHFYSLNTERLWTVTLVFWSSDVGTR